jgi:hypothetical protein
VEAQVSTRPLGSGDQDGSRIHIVLGLRQHVGRQMPWIAVGGNDQDFSGASHEVDAHIARKQLLGRRHVDAARSHDAVRARHGARAVGEGRDGLRAAHLKYPLHSQKVRGTQDLRHAVRAGHADIGHAGHLRRNHGHHQRGWQRIASRGNVGCDGIERAHDLPQLHAGTHFAHRFGGHLHYGERANVGGGGPHGVAELRRKARAGALQIGRGHRDGLAVEPIELARVFEQRLIAPRAHRCQNRAHHGFGFGEPGFAPRHKTGHGCGGQNPNHKRKKSGVGRQKSEAGSRHSVS